MNKKVEISFQDEKIELPVIIGSENEQAVDISKLRSQTGLITLDRGFKNTGSTSSSITFLDGERGVLRYRGYSIEELAQHSSFLEVSYLLINGQLPNVNELHNFKSRSLIIHRCRGRKINIRWISTKSSPNGSVMLSCFLSYSFLP